MNIGMIARAVGVSPAKLQEAFGWAKTQLNSVDINDGSAVNNALLKNGANKELIEKALKWGKGMAKGAQFFGQLKGIDVDTMEQNVRNHLKLDRINKGYNPTQDSFVNYSVRDTRANSLPD